MTDPVALVRLAVNDGPGPDVQIPGPDDPAGRAAVMADAFAGLPGSLSVPEQNKAMARILGVGVRQAQHYRKGETFPTRVKTRGPFRALVRAGRLSPERQRSIILGAAQLCISGVFVVSKAEPPRTIKIGMHVPWLAPALLAAYKAGDDGETLGALADAVGGRKTPSHPTYVPGMRIERLDWVRMLDSDSGVGPDPNDWKQQRRS